MRKLLFALSLIVIATSCGKKNEEPDTPETDLRTGKWRLSAGQVRVRGLGVDSTSNYFRDTVTGFIAKCQYDDYVTFKTNYQGTASPGTNICSSDQSEEGFTWEFSDGWKKLHIYNSPAYFHTEDVNADVIKFSDGVLSIRYTIYDVYTVSPGFTFRDTLTYSNTYTRF